MVFTGEKNEDDVLYTGGELLAVFEWHELFKEENASGCTWVRAPDTVDLASGRDLNSICGGRKVIWRGDDQTTTDAHQCPITFPVDIFPLYIHLSTAVNEITEHINKCILDDSLSAHHRFHIPPKGWKLFLRLLQFAGDVRLLFGPSRYRIY